MDREKFILHETENLYLYQTKTGLEIRLNQSTHSVVIGKPTQGIERAKLTMERLENDIDSVKKMYKCY